MSRRTQARRQAGPPASAYGAFTLSRRASQRVPLAFGLLPAGSPPAPPYNPGHVATPGLGSSPFARRYSGNLVLDFLSCRYLDGSLPGVFRMRAISFAPHAPVIQTSGLPHSDTRGSSDIGSYPRLFAAGRVLPRLAAPRHPP